MRIIFSDDIPRRKANKGRSDDSTFAVITSPPGKEYRSNTDEGKVLYNEYGSLTLVTQGTKQYDIASGRMVLIPPLSTFIVKVLDHSRFYIYKISVNDDFPENLIPLQSVSNCDTTGPDNQVALDTHEKVANFFSTLGGYIEDGLTTELFYRNKARELLFLMKNYYHYEKFASFFRPLAATDNGFIDFVLKNYGKHRTVQDLARASCHSLSAFNKLFHRSFGQSPYSWIKQRRANDIHYELTSTTIPVKELCAKHGFSSLSHFTNFCKRQFGYSPRLLRQMHNAAVDNSPEIKQEL